MLCGRRADRAKRIPDSNVTVAQLESWLQSWFAAMGSRIIPDLMQSVELEWDRGSFPHPIAMARFELVAMVENLLDVDSTLHPRHSRIVEAMINEHERKILFKKGNPGTEALKYARLVLRALSKYRDLGNVRDPRRKESCFAKVTQQYLGQKSHKNNILQHLGVGG